MNIYNIVEVIENNHEIYNILRTCPYEMLKKWEIVNYKKHSIILRQGEIYDCLYIIVEGYADIFMTSENGKRYSQAIYNKGNFIGELEIFNRLPFSCSVEALTDMKLLKIDRDSFLKWIEMDRNISIFINKSLSRQFYDLSKKAGQDTLHPLKQRVCKYLLSSAKKITNKKYNIQINIEKNILSSQLAVTKRSINRVLHILKEKNIINVENNLIIIKDLELLIKEEKISRKD